jgi:hypothetical protein
LRAQVRASLIFNGHTKESVDALDEVTMNEITVMYADGIIGNQGLLSVLGSLVAGVFNYTRNPQTSPYTLKQILNNSYGYIYKDAPSNPNDALLTFMTQAQGFSLSKFKKE